MVRKIPLTQGKHALVDDEFYEELLEFKWHAQKAHSMKNRELFYACHRSPNQHIQMHRLIMRAKKGMVIDHINGNGLDNRIQNLREVTQRQNTQNYHITDFSSKYPGVHWKSSHSKWCAQIKINGEKKHLGLFKSEKLAFKAYKKAVKDLTGESIVCELGEV